MEKKHPLRNAIARSGKTIAAISYEYGVSLPTVHKALRGEGPFQPRVKTALAKVITDNPKA